jgi:hypothetical protein
VLSFCIEATAVPKEMLGAVPEPLKPSPAVLVIK